VHRLDKDTSGALVIAKNETALQGLSEQFKRREVTKEYLALVAGHLQPGSGRIETLIGRHPVRRQRMAVRTRGGRQAVTVYETLEQWPCASLLNIRIETGRTHQIRVHLSHLGHPVLGDTQYGAGSWRAFPAPLPRQMLHARHIVFRHPHSGKRMEFTAPLPSDMAAVIDLMGSPISPGRHPIRDLV
ncbi:MAG: RluA family pseudouridine synthase, partial [Lentisphaerae bacterium]|nr:RluA family pseudouridine synthase [Lentisphaerota bacterium]